MKFMKKLVTLLMAVVMTFAMSVPVFAADGVPQSTDTSTITVKGVTTDGAVVTAYHIIEGNYATGDQGGLIGWKDLTGQGLVTNDGAISVTAEKINAIDTSSMTGTALSKSGNDYTASGFTAGTYLIKVTNSGTDIYNDMVVSLAYGDDGNLTAGEVDASGNFTPYENGKYGAVVYAKKTSEDIKKEYDNSTDQSVQIGDTVPFTITTTIPSYDKSVKTAEFTVTDTASEGLTLPADVDKYTVTVGGVAVNAENAVVAVNGQTFTVTFSSDYVKSLAAKDAAGRAVEIKYTATVNEKAASGNVNDLTNEAKITFANESGTTEKTTTTHEYTFTYNGDGKVATKVDDTTDANPLAGAEFTIYTDSECKTKFTYTNFTGTSTTTSEGKFSFAGLDADKTYYVKETKAPAGYSLLTTTMSIKFNPTYNADGTLASYTVVTKDFNGQEKTVSYGLDESGTFNVISYEDTQMTNIKNTRISQLPSTGGRGTLIFTLLGCAVMIVFAAFYFRSKKSAR